MNREKMLGFIDMNMELARGALEKENTKRDFDDFMYMYWQGYYTAFRTLSMYVEGISND